jgi:hypothetical protein
MILEAALFCASMLLKTAFKITTLIRPSFKQRLMERDLSFVVRTKKGPAAGLFRLEQGKLSYSNHIDGFINFSVIWNGWGSADTLKKKMRLNLMDLLNTGIVRVEGDISSLDYLLVLLGGMINCFRKKQLTPLTRAELQKEA